MKRITNKLALGVAAAITISLSACGGSGVADGTAVENANGGAGSFSNIPSYTTPEAQALVSRSLETASCEVSELEAEMLTLVNEARSEGRNCGDTYYPPVGALTWNCKLAEAGKMHNEDMVLNNFFSHTGSDGLKAGSRIDRTGYSWRTYGENLAAGFIEPKDAMEALLESPGHCKNIMTGAFKEFGAASIFYTSAEYQHYWSQVFGTSF